MTAHLHYGLDDGYVVNWLLAGPATMPSPEAGEAPPTQPIAATGPTTWQVVEGEAFRDGHYTATWRNVACGADRLLDVTAPLPGDGLGTPAIAWAYTEVVVPRQHQVTLMLAGCGVASLWVADTLLVADERLPGVVREGLTRQVRLDGGANRLVLRLQPETGSQRLCAIAVRFATDPQDAFVRLPVAGGQETAHRGRVEAAVTSGHILHDVVADNEELAVIWPTELDMDTPVRIAVRVQNAEGQIIAEARPQPRPGLRQPMLQGLEARDGPYIVRLMADPPEYYAGLRLHRDHPVYLLRHSASTRPQGSVGERGNVVLDYVSRLPGSVLAETVKIALGRWEWVDEDLLRGRAAELTRSPFAGDDTLLCVLHLLLTYGEHPLFPEKAKHELWTGVLNVPYGDPEAHASSASPDAEEREILQATCQVLAGRLHLQGWPGSTQTTGQRLLREGEERALRWLTRRAQYGFRAWSSPSAYDTYVLALVHLIDWAPSQTVAEMAAVVVDKLLFEVALQSFRGSFGSSHGTSRAQQILDSRLEPTSPLEYLLWGLGCLNPHGSAAAALALSEGYGVPSLIQSIAQDSRDAMWARERHLVRGAGETDDWEAVVATYKTPDAMLSSVQDYAPRTSGHAEHIWQATLSPRASIFVTHPAVASIDDAWRPNFWLGNASLPRVAQWQGSLVALYHDVPRSWMGYTHAHWPVASFDDHVLRGDWAFARVDSGYVALAASAGLELVRSGPNAYRELRGKGRGDAWVCHLGRQAVHGSFAEFQDRVLRLDTRLGESGASCETPEGDRMALGWNAPFVVNGEPRLLAPSRHMENPYCTCDLGADTMVIQCDEWAMQLDMRTDKGDDAR